MLTEDRGVTREALVWAARQVGDGARVLEARRLAGGITSAVHALAVQAADGARHRLVLRRWVGTEASVAAERVRREARVLEALASADLPVPSLVAADPSGAASGGVPSLLMTRLRGHVHLAPRDPEVWLRQLAAVLPRIHDAPVDLPPYDDEPDPREVPVWSARPALWARALALAEQPPTEREPRPIHGDFQHFNVLWAGERLTGVVDWVSGARGAVDLDVGHCRLNLAVLFAPEWAERFRALYEAEAGRRVDPVWDATALLRYLPGWDSFVQVQAGRRARVDRAGMHQRVEELLALALRRG